MLGNLQPSNVYTHLHLFEHRRKFQTFLCPVCVVLLTLFICNYILISHWPHVYFFECRLRGADKPV